MSGEQKDDAFKKEEICVRERERVSEKRKRQKEGQERKREREKKNQKDLFFFRVRNK